MELHIEVRGDKKPSTTMSIEIVRFYAFAAPGSSLGRHRSSISTAESGLKGALNQELKFGSSAPLVGLKLLPARIHWKG